ncbi:endonuclease/exonuclease/phosphatase family protein [Terrabacter terrigena]|uniref:Endonuclease/exonuclease/phosphatase family protein n=1 Tax=Terrabacter terrigena TaxID=574718 RepID=A0ABW3N0C2_9MICO
MRVRLVRSPRWAAAATCFVVLSLGCLAGCDAGPAASDPTSSSRPTTGGAGTAVRVLQMNLCNSGRADCYSSGRAVSLALALIHEHRPQMVSLNEVCRDDLGVLGHAMSSAFPATTVASAFTAAQDRPTQAPVRCQNGQEFGDGVLVVVSPPAVASRSYSGVYPVQDHGDPEGRVWVCIDLATRFAACTTHTTSASTTTALDQCRYLLSSVVPGISRRNDGAPIILGADLNLSAHGSPSPDSCLPSGYQRADDDRLQDVVVSPGVAVRSHSVIDMQGTTDHPGLLVDVVLARH